MTIEQNQIEKTALNWIIFGFIIYFSLQLCAMCLVSDIPNEGYALAINGMVIWILIQMIKLCVIGIIICGVTSLICYIGSILRSIQEGKEL